MGTRIERIGFAKRGFERIFSQRRKDAKIRRRKDWNADWTDWLCQTRVWADFDSFAMVNF